MTDTLEIVVVDLPGICASPDLEALDHQADVTVTRLVHPTFRYDLPLVIVPDTSSWSDALAWVRESGWSSALEDRRGLVLGLGLGTALLGQTIGDGGQTTEGLRLMDIATHLEDGDPMRCTGTVMGVDIIATSTAARITCGSEAIGWVHLNGLCGAVDEGALRFSDAAVMGTSLTGLFSRPALRDVFCTEIGRRSGLTYVA
ncbi:MAG: hypothetical protein NVSMB4_16710 [Acidimicrobiales bacterium]